MSNMKKFEEMSREELLWKIKEYHIHIRHLERSLIELVEGRDETLERRLKTIIENPDRFLEFLVIRNYSQDRMFKTIDALVRFKQNSESREGGK